MKRELFNTVAGLALIVGTMIAMYNVLIFMLCD